MKKLFVLVLVGLMSISAFAQEKNNDGWFVTVGGGTNFSIEGLGKASTTATGFAPAITVNVGKWFNPSIGVRVDYNGFKLKNKRYFNEGIKYNTVTADFMWNILNTFGGYNPDRTVGLVPYIFVGAAFGVNTIHQDGLGLMIPIRLTDVISIVPDFKLAHMGDQIYSNVNAGHNGAIEGTIGLRFSF